MDAQQVQRLLSRAQTLQEEAAVAGSRLEDSRTRLASLKTKAVEVYGTDHVPTLQKTVSDLEAESETNVDQATKLLEDLNLG